MAIDNIHDQLIRDEKEVLWVYDDANSKPILPGYLVIGNPTIGIGRNISKGSTGISQDISRLMERDDVNRCESALGIWCPWAQKTVDKVRYNVLVNMTFNMGIAGLIKFTEFLRCMQTNDWTGA